MDIAVLLSGGVGRRIDTVIPKQYVRINGHMIVTYALKPLLGSSSIDMAYIVADEEWHEAVIEDAMETGLDS